MTASTDSTGQVADLERRLRGSAFVLEDAVSHIQFVLDHGIRGEEADADARFVAALAEAHQLELHSGSGDVPAHARARRVSLETVQGDITLHGGGGLVTVHSVSGDVHVSGVRGQLEAHSTNGAVEAEDVTGSVNAETVNGDVTLRDIRSDDVSATTVNGDIEYRGTIRDAGQYRLSNHNGDVTVAVPQGANATVTVSTFNGDFDSDFPITLAGGRQGKRFTFTIGTGSAMLDLESFQGSIKLERP